MAFLKVSAMGRGQLPELSDDKNLRYHFREAIVAYASQPKVYCSCKVFLTPDLIKTRAF